MLSLSPSPFLSVVFSSSPWSWCLPYSFPFSSPLFNLILFLSSSFVSHTFLALFFVCLRLPLPYYLLLIIFNFHCFFHHQTYILLFDMFIILIPLLHKLCHHIALRWRHKHFVKYRLCAVVAFLSASSYNCFKFLGHQLEYVTCHTQLLFIN